VEAVSEFQGPWQVNCPLSRGEPNGSVENFADFAPCHAVEFT
jgi:hypothetical protein